MFDPTTSDYVEATVYRRADIGLGVTIPGPAALAEDQTTTIVPGGFSASVNELGHLVLSRAS
jgi:N-methylhydantoinase A